MLGVADLRADPWLFYMLITSCEQRNSTRSIYEKRFSFGVNPPEKVGGRPVHLGKFKGHKVWKTLKT
jgi:hypothetical protein